MRIASADRNSWIEIEQHGDENYRSCALRARVELGHGRSFAGENGDVYFFDLPKFAAELDSFILNRDLVPLLEGTYGSCVKIWRGRSLNVVLLSFAIGDAFCGLSVTSEYKVEGTFQIEQESLNSLVAFFKSLSC